MNKKEIAEIKKQFTPDNNVITNLCGCYVDGDKNIIMKSKRKFSTLPEEDAFKYFEIFKSSLSGTLGKNLLNMEFPLEQEKEGGTQEFLLRLRDSQLDDDELIDQFYSMVIDNYVYGMNYYIILLHGIYDVPGKASDGEEMFDASDTVFNYILCCICPVNLSKSGLSYIPEKNVIEDRVRDWIVENPQKGFLFPAFNDRNSDIHQVLYYSKNPEELQEDFIANILGSRAPMTAVSQKETFNSIISETLGDDCDYEVIKNIHENLNELIEENKDEPEPLVLTKNDVKRIFEKSEVPDEKMETFEKDFEEIAGEKAELLASNIASPKKFNIETPDVVIKINSDRTDLVETRIIDGKECLVITVNDHIEVNGVNVRTIRQEMNSGTSNQSEEEFDL